MANNKIEIDAGMVTPRQPLGREDARIMDDAGLHLRWCKGGGKLRECFCLLAIRGSRGLPPRALTGKTRLKQARGYYSKRTGAAPSRAASRSLDSSDSSDSNVV